MHPRCMGGERRIEKSLTKQGAKIITGREHDLSGALSMCSKSDNGVVAQQDLARFRKSSKVLTRCFVGGYIAQNGSVAEHLLRG